MTTEVSQRSSILDSALRTPDWRWQQALQRVQSGKRSRPRDQDDWVDRAVKHLRAVDDADREEPGRPRGRFDPHIENVRILFSDENYSRSRWLLEALLLTGLPLDQIAKRRGYPLETVQAYEALCFSVCGHLEARDWILLHAVKAGLWNNYGGGQMEPLWKYFAYVGGEHMLDAVLAATGYHGWPDSFIEASRTDSRFDLDQLKVNILLTIKVLTAGSDEEARAIIGLHERANKAGTKAQGNRRQSTGMESLMEYFLGIANKKKGRSKKLKITLDRPLKSKKKAPPKVPSWIRG